MQSSARTVVDYARGLPEGTVFTSKQMAVLFGEAATASAVATGINNGALLAMCDGMFVAQVHGRFGPRPPSTPMVVESLRRILNTVILPNGAAAANWLRLSTQIPVRQIYLTSGSGMNLRLGKQEIEIRHVPNWQVMLGDRPAGKAIRAVEWLGKEYARTAFEKLRDVLAAEEWQALLSARGDLPSWIADAITEVAAPRNVDNFTCKP